LVVFPFCHPSRLQFESAERHSSIAGHRQKVRNIMSAIIWAPTAAAVTAAIENATTLDEQIGFAVGTRLQHAGQHYDALFTAPVLAEKAATEARHAAATAEFLERYQDRFEQVDRVARWAEASAPPQPIDGEVFVASVPIPFAETETPVGTATATIGALHVRATHAGVYSNTITATVSDSVTEPVPGAPEWFRLTISRGSYTESFDPAFAGAGLRNASNLIEQIAWSSATRPVNGTHALTGGSGRAFATLQARIARALTLPLTAQQKGTVAAYHGQASLIARDRPTFRPGPLYKKVIDRETTLVDALAAAQAWLAARAP
jgi:hypothetical protein